MKFPAMNKRPRQAVVVPKRSGGLNLRDSVSMINDNQLIDCKNVWFRDGVLKTRAAVKSLTDENSLVPTDADENLGRSSFKSQIYPENSVIIDGKKYTLEVMRHYVTRRNAVKEITRCREVHYRYICEDNPADIINLGSIKNGYEDDVSYLEINIIVQKDGFLYSFVIDNNEYLIYKAEIKEGAKHEIVTEEEIHAPTILINCDFNISEEGPTDNTEEWLKTVGTQWEGYNLLGNYYKIKGNLISDGALIAELRAYLLHNVEKHLGKKVTAEIVLAVSACQQDENTATGSSGAFTHTVELINSNKVGDWFVENKPPNDGLYMWVSGTEVRFCYSNTDPEMIGKINDFNCRLNNITITAPCPNSIENQKKVFNMKKTIWFAGDSEGISGGTRLFLGGNTQENEKSLIVWNDLNNMLYFSENNYAYLGDKANAVTTFGKQGEHLIIFKEKEIFATYYQKLGDVTAEDIMNQSAIDASTLFARFPMIQLHTAVGCDCPDTVQLCRNRLVWANSTGKVYTLISQNQYNERAIFEISDMVERLLKTETKENLMSACGVDWEGRYLLFCGNKVYVMEYNSYGYTHAASYTKQEDANIKIPWYYWELPIIPDYAASCGEKVLLPFNTNLGNMNGLQRGCRILAYLDLDGDRDEIAFRGYSGEVWPEGSYDYSKWETKIIEHPILSEVSTKLFEFGAQGYRKNVDKVMLSLGNNGGVPIKVEFITDEGSEEEYVTLDGEDTKAYSPGYVKSVPLKPCIRSVERFGVKLSCEGPLAVDGITLFYRILGGVK